MLFSKIIHRSRFDEFQLVAFLRDLTLQLGRAKVVAATTGISVLMSVVATAANLYTFGFWGADYVTLVSMLIATVIPLLVAYPVSWFVVSIVFSIHRLERETHRLATYDPLTGLLNRRAFLDAAYETHRALVREQQQFAMLILDLDYFKQINDTYGHAVGDRVLEEFGQIVSSVIRPGDLTARIGGEEFAFLLPNTTDEAAWRFAEQLQLAIRTKRVEKDEVALHFSASIGLVVCSPTITVEKAMSLADRELYQAKASGRNQSALYTGTVNDCLPHARSITQLSPVVTSAAATG
jgi:diguanylate cyclase (GGDEF)-like protein